MFVAGAGLFYSSDAGANWTEIANVASLTPPSLDRGPVKTTKLKSVNAVKSSHPGWRELGEISFEIYHAQAVYVALLALYMVDGDPLYWKVELPLLPTQVTPEKIETVGWLSKLGTNELGAENDDEVMLPCTVKLTPLDDGSFYFLHTNAT